MAGASDSPEDAALRACASLHAELCSWIGSIGCHTLFTRALRIAQSDYQGLSAVTLRPGKGPPLHGVEHVVAQIGSEDTAAALEAMLVALLDLLQRFIGDDIVAALVQRSTAVSSDNASGMNERTENGEG
jgi:hypothetical protein